MILERPYFAKNSEWFKYENGKLRLTDKAPQKAIESFEQFQKDMNEMQERMVQGFDAPKKK